MLVTHSVRGDGKGESKPRNKRKYDEGARDKIRRGGDSPPGQKLPKRARSDDDDFDDAELEDDDLDEDDEFDLDEDDDFEIDEDDDFEVDGDDWEKEDD